MSDFFAPAPPPPTKLGYYRKSNIAQKVHYVGKNLKSLHLSVEASLKELRTSYIDIFYVHWEMGLGDDEWPRRFWQGFIPGCIGHKANQYAKLTGKTPFVIYQGAWSILQRDFEREIIPMARDEGLALAPWNVLAGGRIRTDEEEQRRRKTGENGHTLFDPRWERNEDGRKICKALEVAAQVGTKSIQAVAVAYVLQKTPNVHAIVGGRKIEQLEANIEALNISLSEEQVAYLEGILPFDGGFPSNFVGNGHEFMPNMTGAANFVKWPRAQAIRMGDL